MSSAIAPFTRVQPALASLAARPEEDLPLAALSARAGLSPFHFHRLFSAVAGETPKQYTLRLRICRGAALLLTSERSVLDIALSCGFQSHEAFTRGFARQFGMTPRAYRARGFARGAATAGAPHAALVRRVSPCVGLFHVRAGAPLQRDDMSYSIVTKDLAPQPVLIVRRRVKRSEIAAAIGESLPHIFQYAQQHGIPLAGHPFTRYVDVGAGLMTIEPGMRVAGPRQPSERTAAPPPGESAVIEDVLPGGPAVTTIHEGSYETLSEAYGALEKWMESERLPVAGAPWESYITDPAEHPDPKDWKTEVCWPVKSTAERT
jgi:AraC family transcriptional regulator